jgi:hypothetical protein
MVMGKPRKKETNMSKNLTRKGLAFGAGLSLIASGFAGLPAQATGIGGDFVTLAPTFGDQYAVHVTDTFTLNADFATGVSATGQDLKFLVSDPNSALRVDVSPGQAVTSGATIAATTASASGGFVTVTVKANATDASGQAFTGGLLPTAGDIVTIKGLAPAALNGTFTVESATAASSGSSSAVFTYKVASAANISVTDSDPSGIIGYDLSATAALRTDATVLGATSIVAAADGEVSARSSNGSFVVNSLNASNSNSTLLRVAVSAAVTTSQTPTITAWVDSNDNGVIDTTEYVSDLTTVQFMKVSDITAQATLVPPKLGDDAVKAQITTVPVLNGAQLAATTPVRAAFTRAGSDSVALSGSATQAAVTGVWTASVTTDVGTNVDEWDSSAKTVASGAWNQLTDAVVAAGNGVIDRVTVVVADKVATVTTFDNGVTPTDAVSHNLLPGDKVTFVSTANNASANLASKEFTVTSVPSLSTFTFATTLADGTYNDSSDDTENDYTVTTWGSNVSIQDRVYSGDYSAQAALYLTGSTWDLSGTASVFGTLAATSADVYFQTAGSATVQGRNINTGTDEEIKVKAGTASVAVTLRIVDKDGASVGAGRSVLVDPTADGGSTNLAINGVDADRNIAQTLVTDANGQIALTVTDTLGANGTFVTIDATPEGVAAAISTVKIIWATQAYGLVDLNTTNDTLVTSSRTLQEKSSYVLSLMIADQWFQTPADGDYQLVVTGEGVTSGILAFTAGRASVTVTDAGVKTAYDSVLQLQKKNTLGTYANSGSVITIDNNVVKTPAFLLNANGQNLNGGTAADLSDAVAKVALVELDKRLSGASTPLYANDVVISGKAVRAGANTGLDMALVTISGPSNILFENEFVAKRGSLTFRTAADGTFTVMAYSTTAQTDSVITLTVGSVSTSTKVTFTGIGVGEGTSLVVTMPAAVKPASTFQVKAKLSDAFGNGVVAADGRVKVTYTGAGIVFGTLPTSTDANGELMFSVLLGSNDTGSVNVTVSYDQNGDKDYVDAKDLVTAGTTAITASGKLAASSDTIVNVGTFSGKLVVYALNAAGSEVSYKIAGKWVTQVVTSDLLQRYDRVVGATGKTIKVDIYVDGVLKLAKSVVTK